MRRRCCVVIASTLALACNVGDGEGSASLFGGDQDSGAGAGDGGVTRGETGTTVTTTGTGSADAPATSGSSGTSGSPVTLDDTSAEGTTAEVDTTASSSESGPSSASTSSGTETIGCADGQREGFVDLAAYPDIAGCSGAWDVPGVLNTTAPACDRQAGDEGLNINGTGCTVSDSCAEGWHVCQTATEVDAKSPNGCVGATEDVMGSLFFATRQSGVGQSACSAGANDFHGCGNLGAGGLDAGCAPLNRTSNDLCTSLPLPWSCPGSNTMEANQVVKSGSQSGGVLCCVDD